jgi:hypothetical protein
MQINVRIIAASIPTLKPILKRKSGTSNANQYNQYDDIEKPKIIGSERRFKPRRSILSTLGTRTDAEDFKITTRLSPSGQNRKIKVNTVSEERAGSEDLILENDGKNMNRTRCTTKVVVNSDSVGTAR